MRGPLRTRVRAGGPSPEAEKQSSSGKLGLSLKPLTGDAAKQLGLPSDTTGLVVTDVDQDGAASEAGILRGDVILEINRRPVQSLEDVQSALDNTGGRPVLMLVASRGQTVYLTVKPK